MAHVFFTASVSLFQAANEMQWNVCVSVFFSYPIFILSMYIFKFLLQFAGGCILGVRCWKHNNNAWKQNCSVISASLASGISHSTGKLQQQNKVLWSASKMPPQHRKRDIDEKVKNLNASHLNFFTLETNNMCII